MTDEELIFRDFVIIWLEKWFNKDIINRYLEAYVIDGAAAERWRDVFKGSLSKNIKGAYLIKDVIPKQGNTFFIIKNEPDDPNDPNINGPRVYRIYRNNIDLVLCGADPEFYRHLEFMIIKDVRDRLAKQNAKHKVP